MDNLQLVLNNQNLPIFIFGAIATTIGFVLMAARDMVMRRGDRALMASPILRRLPRNVEKNTQSSSGKFDVWFERTVYLANLNMSTTMASVLMLLMSMTAGLAAFVWTEDPIISGITGLFALVLLFLVLIIISARRLKQIEQQFPGSLDLLARAVRAGESLEQAMQLVGEAVSEPVASEYRRCAKQLEMGLSVSAAMQALSYRINLMDVRIFATALSVHREAGGNLPETLQRLARVIRDRMAYHRQLKSVTSAGRVSALIIATIGPILALYLIFIQPEYGYTLWEHETGRMMLLVAGISQLIGLIVISRMLKSKY